MKKLHLVWENLVTCEQVHSEKVNVVSDIKRKVFSETDGLVTNIPGIVLGIFSADCLPVFLMEPTKKIVGLLHAGWRGTAKKIVPKGVNLLKQKWNVKPSQLQIFFGPHIRKCCYEVGQEVASLFPQECAQKINAKIFLNLEKALTLQLEESGVPPVNISSNRFCTCCEKSFFSYRRDTTPQRMLSFIANLEFNSLI